MKCSIKNKTVLMVMGTVFYFFFGIHGNTQQGKSKV